jgi:membrane protease YdiL (CAAX protease family)
MNLKFFLLALFSWFGLECLVYQILYILLKENLFVVQSENDFFILFLSRTIVATALLVFFFFAFRKFYPKEYVKIFIFRSISWTHLLFFTTIYLFLLGLLSLLHAQGYLVNPPFMQALQNNPPNLLLSVYALVCIGVLIEEFFFRAWLFYILQKNNVQSDRIVFISSFVFCVLHLQYDFKILLAIFPMSLLLGYARLKSHSLSLSVLIHVIHNSLTLFSIYYVKN